MIRAQKSLHPLAPATALLALCALAATAQPVLAQAYTLADTPIVRSSGPVLAAPGEKILLCAANNAPVTKPSPTSIAALTTADTTPLNVTLQILNGVTGAVLASTQLSLPPLGSTELPPDPCINFTVPAATFAPTTSLFVVRIALNPQPLPPGICRAHALSVSLQIFTTDSSGSPTNIRTPFFEPPDPCIHSAAL